MIRVIAIVTTQPGRREEVLAEFRAVVPTVHAEKGCIEYGPNVDAEGFGSFQARMGPDTFVVIETWADAAALNAHSAAAHMTTYGEKTKHLVASRAIHILSPA